MFTQLLQWQNLLLAFHRAAKGKRGQPEVAEFEYRLEENLLSLQRELANFFYRPGRYRSFPIHEPKSRLISAASFRDRVVHHALCNLIEPVFDRSFIHDSYANRLNKGTHRALNRCQQFARRYKYVLSCDIVQFFPAIDHAILLKTLKRKINDRRIIWLIQTILKSGADILSERYDMVYFPGDDLFAALRPRGLLIGNLTSQFWANVYLNPFDHFVKRELRCPAYLRYVDDFLLFAKDKTSLWGMLERIELFLMKYRLTIHPGSHPRPVAEGISFLGFIVYPQRRRLKRRKVVHFQRRLKRLIADYQTGIIDREKLDASVQGWINHARYGNTEGLQKKVLSHYCSLE